MGSRGYGGNGAEDDVPKVVHRFLPDFSPGAWLYGGQAGVPAHPWRGRRKSLGTHVAVGLVACSCNLSLGFPRDGFIGIRLSIPLSHRPLLGREPTDRTGSGGLGIGYHLRHQRPLQVYPKLHPRQHLTTGPAHVFGQQALVRLLGNEAVV